MLALVVLDPTLFAVLMGAGFVLAVVHLVSARFVSVLGWACALVFFALAWNALAAT